MYQLARSGFCLFVVFNRSSLIPEMLLELPINVKRVCRLLGYKVDERRVERLRAAASMDLMLLDEEEFNKVKEEVGDDEDLAWM